MVPPYSWVFGGLHQLGLPLRAAGVVVSWLFAAGTIVLLWAVATWALPLSQSAVSARRGQATLLPLAVLVARLPTRLAWALTLGAVLIAVWMEHYFLKGTLF